MFSIRLGRRSLAAMVAVCGIGGAFAEVGPKEDVKSIDGGQSYERTIDGARYRIHEYTNTATDGWPFTVLDDLAGSTLDYLVIGGGGAGGYWLGGGGGAGGFLEGQLTVEAGDAFDVKVGVAGAGMKSAALANCGGDSSLGDIIAYGGGGGGRRKASGESDVAINKGQAGGSGGGGSEQAVSVATGGDGTAGQGFAGGNSSGTFSGGGGGAGGPGADGAKDLPGVGGPGKVSTITGDSVTYAAGGGGGATGGTAADGGSGIGGKGGLGGTAGSSAAAGSYGCGGGGGGHNGKNSGGGSQGIVIVRYEIQMPKQANEWTEGPDFSPLMWKKGEACGAFTAAAKFGTPVFSHSPEEIAAFEIGPHTVSVFVPEGDDYKGLDPVEFSVLVKDPSIVEPGPDDMEAITYNWNAERASGAWADPVNSWSPAKSDTVHGFPANDFATASFPTGDFEVAGDENAYTIVDVVKANGGTVTLKGGTYAMTKTGTDIKSIGTGALVLDGASLTSACVWRPQGRIELKNGAAYTFTTGRIRPDGGLVATDSTLNGFLDLQNSGTCVSVSNSTVTLSTIEFGDTANQKSQTIEFCNGSTVTLNGDLTVAGTDNTFVLDDSQFTQAANKSTSFTGANSRMVIRGAAPKFDATSGKAFSAPVTFVLPTDAYEAAPLQLKVGAPTEIVVDNSIVGTPETSVTYPLVTRASVFEASDLACVTVPPFVTVALSADQKTIQVTVLGADKLHQVAFLDSDGQTVLREAETVVDGETVSGVPTDPFHEGYVFTGWSADEGETVLSGNEVAALPITSDMTFVAQYKTSEKTAVTDPQIATSAAYTGLENKPVVPEDEGYTVDWGEGEWITVGAYTVTLKLSDPEKYVWSDGTSDDKVHPFEITRAENSWTTEPTIPTSWAQGSMPDYSLGAAAFGTVTLSCADGELDQLEIGKHTVVFLVVGTDNYTGLEKQVAVKVRPQGLDPTGEDDTVAGDYSWKDGIAEGYWFNPASWTMSEGLTYGYPASELVTAWFKDLTGPVTAVGEEDETVLAAIRMQNSDVALVGGNYRTTKSEKWSGSSQPGSFEFKGEGKTLSVTDTKLTVAGMAFFGKGTTLASTNAVWDTSARIWVVQQNVKLDFDRSDVNYISIGCGNANGEITLHDTTVGTIDCQAGSDVKISLTGTSEITTDLNPAACSGVSVYVGPQASVTRAKNTMLGASSSLVVDGGTFKVNSSGGYLDNAGQSITLQNGAQSDLWTQMGIRGNALGSIFTVDDSTVHAGHTFYCSECAGDSVFAFKGAVPRVIHDKALYQCLFGNSDTEKSETTPVVRFILPQTPYENAPFETSATKVNTLFYANTPIELDITAVRGKGSYPLFKFNNGVNADLLYSTDSAAFVEMLGSCLRAYRTSKNGRQADRTERVTLRVDGNVIYADVAAAPGFSLIVR